MVIIISHGVVAMRLSSRNGKERIMTDITFTVTLDVAAVITLIVVLLLSYKKRVIGQNVCW